MAGRENGRGGGVGRMASLVMGVARSEHTLRK